LEQNAMQSIPSVREQDAKGVRKSQLEPRWIIRGPSQDAYDCLHAGPREMTSVEDFLNLNAI
jgi:hypothetical protein